MTSKKYFTEEKLRQRICRFFGFFGQKLANSSINYPSYLLLEMLYQLDSTVTNERK